MRDISLNNWYTGICHLFGLFNTSRNKRTVQGYKIYILVCLLTFTPYSLPAALSLTIISSEGGIMSAPRGPTETNALGLLTQIVSEGRVTEVWIGKSVYEVGLLDRYMR